MIEYRCHAIEQIGIIRHDRMIMFEKTQPQRFDFGFGDTIGKAAKTICIQKLIQPSRENDLAIFCGLDERIFDIRP